MSESVGKTASRTSFSKRLAPLADALSEVHMTARRVAREASDKELIALASACRKPTGTNCWWATYQAAEIQAEAVWEEQKLRKEMRRLARRASGNAASQQSDPTSDRAGSDA